MPPLLLKGIILLAPIIDEQDLSNNPPEKMSMFELVLSAQLIH